MLVDDSPHLVRALSKLLAFLIKQPRAIVVGFNAEAGVDRYAEIYRRLAF